MLLRCDWRILFVVKGCEFMLQMKYKINKLWKQQEAKYKHMVIGCDSRAAECFMWIRPVEWKNYANEVGELDGRPIYHSDCSCYGFSSKKNVSNNTHTHTNKSSYIHPHVHPRSPTIASTSGQSQFRFVLWKHMVGLIEETALILDANRFQVRLNTVWAEKAVQNIYLNSTCVQLKEFFLLYDAFKIKEHNI